jgi:hypothetical protein
MNALTQIARSGSKRKLDSYACTHASGHCPHFSHPEGHAIIVVRCCHCGGTQRQFTQRTAAHGSHVPAGGAAR